MTPRISTVLMVVLALTLTMAGCFGGLRGKKVRKLREGPPRQLLYSIELTLNGEVISSPRVTVLEGEEASITISGDDLTSDIEIQIEEDGTISAQVVHGGGAVDDDAELRGSDHPCWQWRYPSDLGDHRTCRLSGLSSRRLKGCGRDDPDSLLPAMVAATLQILLTFTAVWPANMHSCGCVTRG